MNRTEFIFATAIILFVAFALGWFACWLLHRLTRVTQAEMGDLEKMARELHDAEETRDKAIDFLETREAELSNLLHQSQAELRAAMDGLRDARHEAEELRAYIERMNAG
ncbi:hypothetical protein QKW60_17520 [Defluviimonas aestuarii]|uniref:hypothetical protein n=1 Tax=Albidovulum aestuarii TaxID=1130726 RepID=UPI00249A1D8D|nr:hypothetical protein [Defluviimonas aestuarii]MDI3338212.1 hypothetical protein [Defluviimonas aestuarii]